MATVSVKRPIASEIIVSINSQLLQLLLIFLSYFCFSIQCLFRSKSRVSADNLCAMRNQKARNSITEI